MELDTYPASAEAFLLVTGVGIPNALASMLKAAAHHNPDLILNIGIAGAYPNSGLQVGDLVMGTSEVYGDIGFELPLEPCFQPVRESNFGDWYREPITLYTGWPGPILKSGRGCTVNSCTGTLATGQLRERFFEAAFETMEGAAVAQAGLSFNIPVCEIRAISNIAAVRDMRPENIQLALLNLKEYLQCQS